MRSCHLTMLWIKPHDTLANGQNLKSRKPGEWRSTPKFLVHFHPCFPMKKIVQSPLR